MNIETEYKWQARDAGGFAKMKKALEDKDFKKRASKVFIVDSYFDDDKGALRADRIALRLRYAGGRYEVTVKGAAQIKDGLAKRSEQTLQIDAKSSAEAMECLRAAFRKLRPGLKGPGRLFVIKNKREILTLESKTLLAEMAFDDCNIITPSKNTKFYEIEMEFKKGKTREFAALAAYLTETTKLTYAVKSKVATAAENL
jgi:inorganic triphosphatase YgiF